MSATVAPSRAATSTSRSRPVKGLAPPASVAAASVGSTTRSPAATRRMAAARSSVGASLTTKPSTPALDGEADLAVADHRGAHVGQALPGQPLDRMDLLGRPRIVDADQPLGQPRLDRDRGQ